MFLDARKPDCMLKECNLGNVVTDAFVFHYANQSTSDAQWTNASIAIQNIGGITASIAVSGKGNIIRDVCRLVCFNVQGSKGIHVFEFAYTAFFRFSIYR